MDNVCIVCCESNGILINYKHTCGSWYLHRECLNNWRQVHDDQCIICRNLIQYNPTNQIIEITNIQNDIETNTITITESNEEEQNNKYDPCKEIEKMCIGVLITFIVISLFSAFMIIIIFLRQCCYNI